MKKPVLYIIHGWTYTTTPWEQTIALLEKKGIRVEMLHVPGLTSPSNKVWTIEDYVKWADRRIPAGAVALGHSNGGRILLNLCAEKPDKLKHLILLDAAGVYESSGKRDLLRTLSKKLSFLKRIPGLTKVWHKLTGATDYARAPENMKQTLANMLDSDAKLDISRVTTPTSILWGKADTVTPSRQAEVMHRLITGSALKLYPDWTHAPYISHPTELAKAIYEAYFHPPVMQQKAIDDTVANSAALAIKKAPKVTLEMKEPANPVAPDVPTKLVLRKDSKITQGMKVSDQEGAAVKYAVKPKEIAQKATDVAKESASANLKKARTEKVPDTNVSAASASANLKKSVKKVQAPIISSANILAGKSNVEPTGIISELDKKSTEKVDFVPLSAEVELTKSQAITTASVPKVSRIEKVKRKVGVSKQARQAQKQQRKKA